MNNVIPQPPLGAREGNWIWDGTRWVCDPDCDARPPWPPFRPQPPWFPPPATSPPWYPGGNAGVSFSPPNMPPPNPIRGNFWWDGHNLLMFDGAVWMTVGGATCGGTPPSTTPPANPQPGEQWFDGTTLWIWDGNAWVPVAGTKTYVQATPPPAPNPGDLWFDGTQMRVWSGSAWLLVGPGATVGPVPTATEVFAMTAPTDLPMPGSAAGDIPVPFTATPTVDTLTGWDPVTKKYTPSKPGFYMFQAMAIATTSFFLSILKNDPGSPGPPLQSVTYLASSGLQIASGIETFSITGTSKMNGTTDYVRLFASAVDNTFHNFGANIVWAAILLP